MENKTLKAADVNPGRLEWQTGAASGAEDWRTSTERLFAFLAPRLQR